MKHFNSIQKIKNARNYIAWGGRTDAALFAAILIVAMFASGCSIDRPKPVSSPNQTPITQSASLALPAAPAPVQPKPQPVAKKKVVRPRPATTVTYTDKASGVSFQYPRKDSLKTGDDANSEMITAGSVPTDFVQPGGVTLAAVVLPSASYKGTDLSSAMFDVSVNKGMTAAECGEFSVPQPSPSTPSDSPVKATAQLSKFMVGDLELQSVETVAGEGAKQHDVKYFHVFENDACYEFALKIATTTPAESEAATTPVDRDAVFSQLEKILATVKIAPEIKSEPAPTVAATTPAGPPAEEAPTQ
jgi:hypothetical protein